MKKKRPTIVTYLAIVVLIIVVFFMVRVIQAIRLWEFVNSLDLSVHPIYLVLSGIIFSFFGLPVVWGMWVGRPWLPRLGKVYLFGLVVSYWLDRLIFNDSRWTAPNLPFAVGLTLLCVVSLFFFFSLQVVKNYFRGEPLEIK